MTTKVRTSLFSQSPTQRTLQHPPSSIRHYNYLTTTRPLHHLRKRGSNNYSTSTTRCWRDNNDKASKQSSLFSLDKLQQTARSALESSRVAAEETAQGVAARASSRIQEAASKTMERTHSNALKAKEETLKRVSEKAATATNLGSKHVTEATKNVTDATSKILYGVKQKFSESVSGAAASTKHLQETLTDTSGKALKWFWRWSLAAIFVYGIASALPMAIIRYTMEDKKKKWESRGGTTKEENNGEKNAQEASAVGGGWNTLLGSLVGESDKKE